jgi:hypothetical protein
LSYNILQELKKMETSYNDKENHIKQFSTAILPLALSFTIKIYTENQKTCIPICCGILFSENKKTYILTAEHVFSNANPGDLRFFHKGFLIPIEGTIHGNKEFDIAIFELDKDLSTLLLKDYKSIGREMILFNHITIPVQKYFLIGFPNSSIIIRNHSIKKKPLLYQTAALAKQKKFDNIEFEYNKRKSKSFHQKGHVTAPNPEGLSGSGLWYTTSFDLKNIDVKLVGIFIEFAPKNNIGIAVKLDSLLDFLK